jgi:hypothetical protein
MKPEWFDTIEEQLPEIEKIVGKVDEKYREKLFEILVAHAIETSSGTITRKDSVSPPVAAGGKETQRFSRFLAKYNLSKENIEQLIDLQSGTLLRTDLGKKTAEIQRAIAVLLSIKHCALENEFNIPREELRELCKTHGTLDASNFASIMKKTVFKGKVVFSPTENGWRIPAVSEDYIADMVKGWISNNE